MSVEDTLAEREITYGDFGMGTKAEAEFIDLVVKTHSAQRGSNTLDSVHIVWFSKIIMKLVRLSITPTHIDSWHDIAGYATLVEKELKNAKSE
jgi:hypothetical protein|tara:strand:- start:4890 stop:5168 length:279 start_codon:yes stop_codon:yes gene_type:complete